MCSVTCIIQQHMLARRVASASRTTALSLCVSFSRPVLIPHPSPRLVSHLPSKLLTPPDPTDPLTTTPSELGEDCPRSALQALVGRFIAEVSVQIQIFLDSGSLADGREETMQRADDG